MTPALIRPRSDADVPELAAVLARVYAEDGYPVEGIDCAAEWIVPPGELAAWCATVDGHPVGHVSLTRADPNSEVAFLWNQDTGGVIEQLAMPARLFVDPAHRQSGLGGLLMSAVGEYASSHQLAIAFDVMLKDRNAIRLYEKLGCRRIGVVTYRHSGGAEEPAAVYVAPVTP